jgi:hypothetical protein
MKSSDKAARVLVVEDDALWLPSAAPLPEGGGPLSPLLTDRLFVIRDAAVPGAVSRCVNQACLSVSEGCLGGDLIC